MEFTELVWIEYIRDLVFITILLDQFLLRDLAHRKYVAGAGNSRVAGADNVVAGESPERQNPGGGPVVVIDSQRA